MSLRDSHQFRNRSRTSGRRPRGSRTFAILGASCGIAVVAASLPTGALSPEPARDPPKAPEQNSGELYPIKKNGKYGYIDAAGKIVVEPQFDWAGFFSDGMAQVHTGNKCGYIDPSGELRVAPRFFNAEDFSEGLAAVHDPEGVILPSPVSPIDLGWAGNIGYIRKPGDWAIPPTFSPAVHEARFSEGLASARTGTTDPFGYIDATGKYVIPPRFGSAQAFSEGRAAVAVNRKWGFIDKTGAIAIECRFALARRFSEGLAAVRMPARTNGNDSKLWGYIDEKGDKVLDVECERAYPFYEGRATIRKDSRDGCIDRTGQWIVPPTFDLVDRFRGGLAQVRVGDRWENYRNAWRYGRRRVNGKIGYVDRSGRYVWEPSE